MTKVLVYEYISGGGCTDAGIVRELLPMGRAMRDAIAGDLARVPGVAVTCVADASDASDASDATGADVASSLRPAAPPQSYRVLRAGGDAFDFIRKLAPRYDAVWVIAPETDGVLATFCDAVDVSRWIGCDAASIHIASSKRRTARHLAQAGIETTRAWSADAPLQGGCGAWVVKPDDGAGAVDTFFYRDFRIAECAFLQRTAAHERVTFEEWVEGDALSLSLLCTQGSAELLSINWQHIGVTGGRVAYEGTSVGKIGLNSLVGHACRELATRVAGALPGLAGFVGIDVVWHRERGPVVIEVNPRVTCAYVELSAYLKTPLAARVLAAHCADKLTSTGDVHAA